MNRISIENLNSEFAIEGQLKFIEGEGGFPLMEIDNGKATALISIYAGQVLQFKPAGEAEDLLFLSEKAYYQDGKAIKGGVPVCWPWFGADPEGKGPAHGFVRNRPWELASTEATTDGKTKVVLSLKDSEQTREIWPHAFNLELEITVGNELTLELVTRNTGSEAFLITQALHTYFKVGDITQAKVLGLENCSYLDKVDHGAEKTQDNAVAIAGEVDRIYAGVQNDLTIDDPALNRKILICFQNSKTAVVWNPWDKIAASMADLNDDDYKQLLCVETANAADEVVEVAAGSENRLVAIYQVAK